jgi:hypothetical protein
MAAASWQFAHSWLAFWLTANGLLEVGAAWHVSHWAPATGACTLVLSSLAWAELCGVWQVEQDPCSTG